VAAGIALFVGMLSVYESLEMTRDEYFERHRLADVFASLERAPASVAARLRAIDGVEVVETRIVRDVAADVEGLDEPATVRLVSMPEDAPPLLNELFLRTGRRPERGAALEVVASDAFASANGLRLGDAIGAVVGGRWRRLRIVGTALSPEFVREFQPGVAMFADNRRFGVLWMGRDALQDAFGMTGAFNDVVIGVARGSDPEAVVDRVDRVLAPYGCVAAMTRRTQPSCRIIDEELAAIRGSGLVMPVLFIIIASLLLSVVLGRVIAMQRDQIAVLKAFGYTNVAVGLHVFSMGVAVALAGAVIGVGSGVWFGLDLTAVYTTFYRFPVLHYSLSPTLVGLSVAIALVSAALGTWGTMRHVVALAPATAMRPEAPARFRPGVLERLGFQSLLSSSARLVIRNFERNPWKATFAVLGVAIAVAVLMLGRYAIDANELMRDRQFRTIQREDVAAVFALPRSPSAMTALAGLPGVLRIEPYRSLAVRLHAGHRSRTVAIQGVDSGAELRRIVDDEQRVFTPEDDALVMTAFLAEILALEQGDTVAVEILEGRRRTHHVRVGVLVREIIGLSAYMHRPALDRLAGSPAVSGAYMIVDDAARDALYHRLKRTPGVAGAVIREVTIESFDRTIKESEDIRQVVVGILGVIMAVGIVYNSARIALSERGRELASLRVLGFTRREVTSLLLGEQALLTLLALPLGYPIGYGFDMLMSMAFAGELWRMPVVVTWSSYLYSAGIVVASSFVSGLLVRRRLHRLDLIEVLKTRE
jgi:putative ABC transport system permease protein